MGADPAGTTPQEFANFLRTETLRWAVFVKAAGIRVD